MFGLRSNVLFPSPESRTVSELILYGILTQVDLPHTSDKVRTSFQASWASLAVTHRSGSTAVANLPIYINYNIAVLLISV